MFLSGTLLNVATVIVGTTIGLAQRLARRDIPPAQWKPDDR